LIMLSGAIVSDEMRRRPVLQQRWFSG
jgi:hypothetical protein